MRERGAELWAWLEDVALFYICGDAPRMAKDVEAALKDVICRHGGKSVEQANDYLWALKWGERYLLDVH